MKLLRVEEKRGCCPTRNNAQIGRFISHGRTVLQDSLTVPYKNVKFLFLTYVCPYFVAELLTVAIGRCSRFVYPISWYCGVLPWVYSG